MSSFTEKEAKVLNTIQKSFPMEVRPFDSLSGITGIPASEIIDIIGDLKKREVVRNIAGIFNGESLGYYLSLVALKVDEADIDRAVELINSHPGVNHNYHREHDYNIWFTLAGENEEMFRQSLDIISEKSGAKDCLVMRNEKLYKIGFMLSIGQHGGDDSGLSAGRARELPEVADLSAEEREAVILLQKDMPLVEEPFRALSEESEMLDHERLIGVSRDLKERNVMRRYAAVLRHRNAGFSFNAMTAWKAEPDKVEDIIQPFIDEEAVTHLYMRTIYPGRWEHPLFAMIHAKGEDELDSIINRLSIESGIKDRLVLRSLQEFKKMKVIYFSNEFKEWGK